MLATRFQLESKVMPGGVILRVRESGFGSLPPGMIDGNAKWWDQELRYLAAYAEQSQG